MGLVLNKRSFHPIEFLMIIKTDKTNPSSCCQPASQPSILSQTTEQEVYWYDTTTGEATSVFDMKVMRWKMRWCERDQAKGHL